MPTTLEQTDHRKLPRKKRPPTKRDQAIYCEYKATACSRLQLAKKYGRSERRISGIILRVERWLEGPAGDLRRLRLDREMERARGQHLYERALHEYDNAPRELVTIKDGERNGQSFHEETRRQQPAPTGLLRVAARVHTDLSRLADKPPIKEAEAAGEAEMRESVVTTLIALRKAAIKAGKLPEDFVSKNVIRDLLKFLLGEPTNGLAQQFLWPSKKKKETSSESVGRDSVAEHPAEEQRSEPTGPPTSVRRGSPDPAEAPTEGLHDDVGIPAVPIVARSETGHSPRGSDPSNVTNMTAEPATAR